MQPSNTSIVSFMLFSFVPPLFVGQNVVELTTKTYLRVHPYKWFDLGYQCQRNSISQRCRETTQKCHWSHFDCTSVVGNEWEHYFKCQSLEGECFSHKERSVFFLLENFYKWKKYEVIQLSIFLGSWSIYLFCTMTILSWNLSIFSPKIVMQKKTTAVLE